MRLFDATGNEAMELLADLMTPISELFTDKEVATLVRSGHRIEAIKLCMNKHPSTLFEIMAVCDTGEPVEEYKKHTTATDVFDVVLKITNDPKVLRLFTSQEQTAASPSGPATVTTTE